MRAVHNLSKESREKIVLTLLERRNKSELARDLGVSAASIVKFYKGKTHPSDETIVRAIKIADEKEKEEIAQIMVEDLIDSLLEIFENYPNIDTKKLDLLRKVLEERDKRKILTSLGLSFV
ncbi:hypothetical protein GWK48_04260 [Metallosphaera tengchongensis]|uniref:Helix-turn-helix domain-containing protein n=1 Tax=Metallosphaera tengchongensis TaxID=1532350 RepID=A0A6N0NVK0_9CREN|nr:hypothetical protein [Metallosphaera tengchongensis]QKQ99708.1 hypothetical protein GWK48_04260 [Metallosphaera tengchongensis]